MKPPVLKSSGDITRNWEDFIENFKRYMGTDEFLEKCETDKLSVFLSSMGDEGFEIFKSFNIPVTEIAEECFLNKLIQRFEGYFTTINVSLYNTCQFFKRVQKKGEPFNVYLTEIKEISKWCQFGPLTKKMIRGRIMFGINDSDLQYRFKTMEDPSVEEVIDKCRGIEALKKKLNSIMKEKSLFSENELCDDATSSDDTIIDDKGDDLNDLVLTTTPSKFIDAFNVANLKNEKTMSNDNVGNEETSTLQSVPTKEHDNEQIPEIQPCASVKTEIKFSCHACDKSFAHYLTLKHHKCRNQKKRKENHDPVQLRKLRKLKSYVKGDKLFYCGFCNKGFSHKGNLQTHVRTHTKDKPFQCNECGKKFIQKALLFKHRERYHVIVLE